MNTQISGFQVELCWLSSRGGKVGFICSESAGLSFARKQNSVLKLDIKHNTLLLVSSYDFMNTNTFLSCTGLGYVPLQTDCTTENCFTLPRTPKRLWSFLLNQEHTALNILFKLKMASLNKPETEDVVLPYIKERLFSFLFLLAVSTEQWARSVFRKSCLTDERLRSHSATMWCHEGAAGGFSVCVHWDGKGCWI